MNQFWCHQCNLTFPSSAEDGSVHCPNCDGEFVELIEATAEEPSVAPSIGPFTGMGMADPRLFAMNNMLASALQASSQSVDGEDNDDENGHEDEDREGEFDDEDQMYASMFGAGAQPNNNNNPVGGLFQMLNMLAGGQMPQPVPTTRQRSSSQAQQTEASNAQPATEEDRPNHRIRQPSGYRMIVNYSPDGGATIQTTTFDGETGRTTTTTRSPGGETAEETTEDTQQEPDDTEDTAEGQPQRERARPPRMFAGAIPFGAAGDSNIVQMDFPTLLQQIFSQVNAPEMGMEGGGGEFMNPLFQMMGMTGNPGDYVTSQRGLDDILTRMMEQTQGKNVPPPATDDMIAQLPREPATVSDLDMQKECPVCQDDFELGKQFVIMPCKHRFHEDCLKHWLKINGTCPVCRFSLITGKKHDHSQDNLNNQTESSSNNPPPQPPSSNSNSSSAPSATPDRRQEPERSRSRSPQRQ